MNKDNMRPPSQRSTENQGELSEQALQALPDSAVVAREVTAEAKAAVLTAELEATSQKHQE